MLEQEIGQIERLSVDGKVLTLLSAVTNLPRTTLRSVPITEKSNEPTEGR